MNHLWIVHGIIRKIFSVCSNFLKQSNIYSCKKNLLNGIGRDHFIRNVKYQHIDRDFIHFIKSWLTRSNIDPNLLFNEGYKQKILIEIENLNWLETDNLLDDVHQYQIAQFIDHALNIVLDYPRFLKVTEGANEYIPAEQVK